MPEGANPTYTIKQWVAIVFILIFVASLTPTIIETVETATQNSSTWNFTGAAAAATMLGLVPLILILSLVLYMVARSMGVVGK